MRKIYLILFFCFFSWFHDLNAQIKSFSKDPKVFIKELQKLMKADNVSSAIEAYKNFEPLWDSISADAYRNARIIKNADMMLEKRMKASPQFELYLNTLGAFYQTGYMPERFVSWQKLFETYYAAKSNEVFGFLSISYELFSRNALYRTADARLWQSDNSNFEFMIEKGEPVILFKKLNLFSTTRDDSLKIENTEGTYYLNGNLFKGKNGRVDWTRGNRHPDTVYAFLKSYTIDLKTNEYEADSVTFYNKKYLPAALLGRLQDKVLSTASAELTRYPKFFSYDKEINIRTFSADVDYYGGFSQQGARIIGYGDGGQPGIMRFYYKDKNFVQIRSEEFIVTDDKIVTDKGELYVFLDSAGGKIYHPQVNLNYVIREKKLSLIRGNEGITRAPFQNTYHNMEIKAEKMDWVVGQPKIEFRTILKEEAVQLYSKNFFREYDYEKLQGLLEQNPLQKIKSFSEKSGKLKFTLQEYVKHLKTQEKYVRSEIILLNDEGYLIFNPKYDSIKINEKLINYVNSHMGRTDYDIISFESIIEKRANATINLINYDMDLEGIGRFRFSDSQYVYVIPDEQKVTIRKDREMIFDGKIRAGRFEIFGKKFRFEYKLFKVDMDEIDSLRFFFPDENNNLRRVNSVIQDITGVLFIDQANNKSGRKDFPEYPIFKSNKKSKVYYDYPYIYGGVYNRENFFFELDPFIIDSLDNFTREGLVFPGTFVSSDIFPAFREQLLLQPEDFSLGFRKKVDMPTYKGNGRANVDLWLSNNGLLAKGDITFATSTTKSQDIVFFPERMKAKSESFELARSAVFPKVSGKNLQTDWQPYMDKMSHKAGDTPFDIFDNVKLYGEFVLSKNSSVGKGKLAFDDAEISSQKMRFDPAKAKADTSELLIKSIDTAKFAFRAKNVNSTMDFDKRIGDFKSNVNYANSEFPYNQYLSSLDQFKWDVKKKTLDFQSQGSKPIEDTYFISTHPDQDKLKFSARKALYDLNDYTLYIDKIPYIDVADSRVYPENGKAIVRANAAMDDLKNAMIDLDSSNKWHKFYKCNVGIKGRLNFGADGYYDYIDKSKKKNTVYFHEIKVDYLSKTTVAVAKVFDTMHFTITPRFEFKGDLTVTGKNRGINFDGYVHPVQALKRPSSGWWRDQNIYAPDNVVFNISEPVNEDKKRLKLGYYITFDSVHTYPSFFSLNRNYSDSALLDVSTGMVGFNDLEQKFYVGDKKKIKEGAPKGNYIYLDDKNGVMYGEGDVSLGANLGQFKIKTAGNVTYFNKDSSIDFSLIMLMDFKLPDEAKKIFTNHIIEVTSGNNATNNSRPALKNALAEWLDEKDYNKTIKKIDETGVIPITNELEALLFFSEVKFSWNQSKKAFVSNGMVGVSGIGGNNSLEKKLDIKIEIKRKRSGDEITMSIQAASGEWYYINFLRRNLYIYSSNDDFNKAIRDGYEKVSNEDYTIKLASPRARTKFLSNFDSKAASSPETEETEKDE